MCMSESAFLIDIFFEHIARASIVPFVSSVTLEAMYLFGGYALLKPIFVGIAGMMCGCLTSWFFGYGLRRLYYRWKSIDEGLFLKLNGVMHHYGWMAAILFPLPLATLIIVLLGFFRVSLVRVGIMVLLGAIISMKTFFLV